MKIGLFSKSVFLMGACAVFLSACTETRYAAHLAKQIPLPTDTPKSKGYFKVGNPYKIKGRRYYPTESYDHVETGIASWYGPGFHGKKTANGEIFDENELTAAHRTLQMPSLVRVTNLENGRSLILRVNDRGPFAHSRVLDVSKRGAELLGFRQQGTARVRVEVLGEESRILAQAAKRGESTAGTEVAMNRDGRLPSQQTRNYKMVTQKTLTPRSEKDGMAILASAKPPAPKKAMHHNSDVIYPNAEREKIAFSDVTRRYAQDAAQMKQAGAFPRNEVEAMSLPEGNITATPSKKPATNLHDVQGHSRDGRFMPDPVVKQLPVKPTSLFVQAGSFSSLDNAQTLKVALGDIGPVDIQSAQVKGQTFHRVRIGPYDTVAKADKIMNTLEQRGRMGTIVVVD